MQIDNLSDLPQGKRPTDHLIWDGTSEELEDWLEKVFKDKPSNQESTFVISDREIE